MAKPPTQRWPSGRAVSPRSWWCSRGGLYVVVRARRVAGARRIADEALARRSGPGRRLSSDEIKVRPASRTDLARWAELLRQEAEIRDQIDGLKAERRGDQGALF